MRNLLNLVLLAVVGVLVYICYASIMKPINFEREKKVRDKAVIARLMEIRKAEAKFSEMNDRQYTASFDTLIDFVKTAKIPFVYKEGVLDDEQLESGLTEAKAMRIINKAKKTGNFSEVKKKGLENFKRDTTWVSLIDTLFPKGFNADSLRFVPFSGGKQFEIATVTQVTKSGAPICLLEVRTPYEAYLGGLDPQEIINMKDVQTKLGKYSGLKIGNLETPNNNAGNWE